MEVVCRASMAGNFTGPQHDTTTTGHYWTLHTVFPRFKKLKFGSNKAKIATFLSRLTKKKGILEGGFNLLAAFYQLG